jgi:hypothetical protein
MNMINYILWRLQNGRKLKKKGKGGQDRSRAKVGESFFTKASFLHIEGLQKRTIIVEKNCATSFPREMSFQRAERALYCATGSDPASVARNESSYAT